MGSRNLLVTSVLLLMLYLTVPAGTVDVALFVVAALAAMMLLAHRADARTLLRLAPNTGPILEGRRLRGAFRRQHRPDAPGRPQPRAPGALVGAL